MPPAYLECIGTVERPFDVLCGRAKPKTPEEGELICDAVEKMLAGFIMRMLVIQLNFLETRKDYKLLSRDSIHRHAACVMLGKGPTDPLTQSDQKVCTYDFGIQQKLPTCLLQY
ncbi:MAG: hypothetical protein EBS90_10680 [Betaproteobacteria bacterium]|nr:hypothetical protein [Betaproteobacteria bacterium]